MNTQYYTTKELIRRNAITLLSKLNKINKPEKAKGVQP